MAVLAIFEVHLTAIDIGEYRSNNDYGILLNSRTDRKFEQNRFNIPPPENLDDLNETVPFFLAGNEKFLLKEWLMRPFSGKQFSDEIS